MIGFEYDDGGRAEAGYKGSAGDCGVRALAIAAEIPYQEAYDVCNKFAKAERVKAGAPRSSARNGMFIDTYRKAAALFGFRWVPTMSFGSGCEVHLRADELPAGRIIARVSKHLVAIVDGTVHDTADPSRYGTRCVYGYFIRED